MNDAGRALLAAFAAIAAAGCFSLKTESEIKPIHITMDINLKVDRELDRAFADEGQARPGGRFDEMKRLLDRGVAGITSDAMLAAREGATDDDRIAIAEANARHARRFEDISNSSGVPRETVQRRYAAKMRERIPEGSGVWYQADDGAWKRR